MEHKHTPGPWSINGNKIDGNGYHIVSVNSHRTSEGEANARLIAAAPELLEIVKSILADDMMQYLPAEYIEKIRSSIAKATGQ